MAFKFADLDLVTRQHMIDEIKSDIAKNQVYLSDYLTQSGRSDWPNLLLAAATSGNDATLAQSVRGRFLATTQKKKPGGNGFISAAVPTNASQVLAESEFNHYYIRGLCLRAIDEGKVQLEVYRAKEVTQSRPTSQQMCGKLVEPAIMLADLRNSRVPGKSAALGIPPGPGSGISLRIP